MESPKMSLELGARVELAYVANYKILQATA